VQGLGDDVMCILTKSLPQIPMVRSLNLLDNRLTDKSLKEVVRRVLVGGNHLKA
jgi:signal transduction histidine kinase